MAEHAHIVRIVSGRPRSGQGEKLLGTARAGAEWMSAQDGCFGAQVCQVKEQPGAIAVVSRWRDQPALEATLQSARYRELTAPMAEQIDGRPSTLHYVSAER